MENSRSSCLPESHSTESIQNPGESGCHAESPYLGESKNGMTRMKLAGFDIEGISVAGQETCIVLPALKVAFDIGRCPQIAVQQDTVLVSHAHLDHLGGIGFFVGTRELLSMKRPNVVMPAVDVPLTRTLLETLKKLDRSWEEQSEGSDQLRVNLHGLDVGCKYFTQNGYIARPFKTYHRVPSQGYILYSVRKKLKSEFMGLATSKIRDLRMAGTQVTVDVEVPEVAFTGDSTAEWITDPANEDALKAKLLIMEVTFIDGSVSIEKARKTGHTALSEVVALKHKFQNEAILFIHFSARYKKKDIVNAMVSLPDELRDRSFAMTERF